MHVLATFVPLLDIGRGFREAFYMFWESLWALVLGFTLSGIVQAMVSRDKMTRRLGNHRAAATTRASLYGMASSSCSFAASSMAKSLFTKGADFTSAMIFMIASTNLVVELGVVLVILLGWQFAVGEFVGGPIMILLVAFAGGAFFTKSLLTRVKTRLLASNVHANHSSADEAPMDVSEESLKTKLSSPAALSDAAQYAIADVTMLRKELVIGFSVAGFLAALVPTGFWNSLFLHGHGGLATVENAVIGPLVAVISWVCSIGNVPLAAALWHGGISFGGVIAFLFADLISMPLLLVYRKLYGWPLTLRIIGLFYPVMVVAGLATQGIFDWAGILPTGRRNPVIFDSPSWNYTTALNLIFILVAGGVWWFARNRDRYGGGVGYATDPVCGMQVEVSTAPARSERNGEVYYFCSNHCQERFERDPARPDAEPHEITSGVQNDDDHQLTVDKSAIDPMCHMTVDPANAGAHRVHNGIDYWFCCSGCAEAFEQDPNAHLEPTR